MGDSVSRDEAIAQLRRAVLDPGPSPYHHYEMMLRHRRQWPTLWRAIDALLLATEPPRD